MLSNPIGSSLSRRAEKLKRDKSFQKNLTNIVKISIIVPAMFRVPKHIAHKMFIKSMYVLRKIFKKIYKPLFYSGSTKKSEFGI